MPPRDHSRPRPTKVPAPPRRDDTPLAQAVAQRAWVLERTARLLAAGRSTFDFATAGSSGRPPEALLAVLARPMLGTRVILDIRDTPFSRHTPAWNRDHLAGLAEAAGLEYVHRPELGVPREVRSRLTSGRWGLEELFEWYDRTVATDERVRELLPSLDRHPVLLCTELSPLHCHRGRLALALERAAGAVSLDV